VVQTYILRLLGPGLGRDLGVLGPDAPSTAAALRFVPAFEPGRLFRLLVEPAAGGARDEDVLVPFMAAVESAGVSAAVESTVGGAGEGSGVEAGLLVCDGDGAGEDSWGNCDSVLGESFRTTLSDLGVVDILAMKPGGDVMSRWGGDGGSRWWWEWVGWCCSVAVGGQGGQA
jgi:hypothetical protein